MRKWIFGVAMGWAAPASAGWIDDRYVDFGQYNQADFSGTDGWVSGYAGDPWSAEGRDYLYAQTDEAGGNWGSGEPIDNHLTITDESWSDFRTAVDVIASDNDAFGVVFRFEDSENFYLAFVVGAASGGQSSASYPGLGEGGELQSQEWSLHLYSVVNGFATEVDAVELPLGAPPGRRRMVIDAFGPAIDIYYDVEAPEGIESEDLVLSTQDEDHTDGTMGFYCYNTGNGDGGCGFDEWVVLLRDLDDDDTWDGDDADADGDSWDAEDDCDDWNSSIHPDAPDTYGNGIDENCDGVDGILGEDTGGTDETGLPAETDNADAGPVRWDKEELTGGNACSCSGSGATTAMIPGLFLALVSAYSRVRRSGRGNGQRRSV